MMPLEKYLGGGQTNLSDQLVFNLYPGHCKITFSRPILLTHPPLKSASYSASNSTIPVQIGPFLAEIQLFKLVQVVAVV